MRKPELKDMIGLAHEIASKRGGECLSPECLSPSSRLMWKCKEQHTWQATPAGVLMGEWCPVCQADQKAPLLIVPARKRKPIVTPRPPRGPSFRTLDQMNEVAARYGGRYLSKEVLNGRKKGLWQCANGHTFKRSATAAKSGRWCTQCNEEKRVAELKTQLSDLAQAQGGVLLSKSCRRLNDICQWKCSEGHTWKMLPHVVRAGAWCPECPPKNLIEDAKKLAKKQGGECLSQKCSSPNRALRWACDQNHVWIASTKQVQNGHWCPICANAASGDSQKVQSDPMKKVGIEIEKKRAA